MIAANSVNWCRSGFGWRPQFALLAGWLTDFLLWGLFSSAGLWFAGLLVLLLLPGCAAVLKSSSCDVLLGGGGKPFCRVVCVCRQLKKVSEVP